MDVDVVEGFVIWVFLEEVLPEGREVEVGVGEEEEGDFGFRVGGGEAGDGAGAVEGGDGGAAEEG